MYEGLRPVDGVDDPAVLGCADGLLELLAEEAVGGEVLCDGVSDVLLDLAIGLRNRGTVLFCLDGEG